MKTYKFRSCSNFEHLTDIIINRRFYCARSRSLNDPMEGMGIPYFHDPNAKYKYDEFKKTKDRCRICSFSRTMRHPLLWAHYAEGFTGVAIEVTFTEPVDLLYKITYLKDFPILPIVLGELPPDPIDYLTTKLNYWKHEREYRIILKGNRKYYWLPKSATMKVLTGIHIARESYELILQLCKIMNIPVEKTELDYKRKAVRILAD
jgi:hypothetical protein